MPHGNVYPDPDIRHGHLRVLPRTDGGFIIIDDRRPLGQQTISRKGKPIRFKKLEDAARNCRDWFEAGHG